MAILGILQTTKKIIKQFNKNVLPRQETSVVIIFFLSNLTLGALRFTREEIGSRWGLWSLICDATKTDASNPCLKIQHRRFTLPLHKLKCRTDPPNFSGFGRPLVHESRADDLAGGEIRRRCLIRDSKVRARHFQTNEQIRRK